MRRKGTLTKYEFNYQWKPNKPKIIPWEDVEKYLNKGYIAEEKRDGARMALHLDCKKIPESIMFNKYRTYDPLRKFPELKGVIDKLLSNMEQQKIKTLTLDGELIVSDSTDKDDFWQLNGRLHLENPMKIKLSTSKVTYIPFDVLQIDNAIFQSTVDLVLSGDIVRPDHDLYWRREQLQSLCANVINPVKRVKKENINIDYCIDKDLEGFVLKHPDESYNKKWFKVKAVVESNFIVVSVEKKTQNTVYDEVERMMENDPYTPGVPRATIRRVVNSIDTYFVRANNKYQSVMVKE